MIPVHPLFIVGFLTMTIVVVLIVMAIVGAMRSKPGPTTMPMAQGAPNQGTPLDILARRFAAGEMSAEDYQKARDLLQGDSPKGS